MRVPLPAATESINLVAAKARKVTMGLASHWPCVTDNSGITYTTLHWLRMSQQNDYKLAVLVYRCLNGLAPSYLASDLQCVADLDVRRRLRSASTSTLVVPVTCLSTVGDHEFPPRVSCGCGPCMEQSAGRCHFVAITADIPETAEDRTVRSELLIAPAASRAARTSFRFCPFFL